MVFTCQLQSKRISPKKEEVCGVDKKRAERSIIVLHCTVGPARTRLQHARMKKRPANCVDTIHLAQFTYVASKYFETGWFTVHLLNAIGFQIAAAFAADTITVSYHDKKTSINLKKRGKNLPLRWGLADASLGKLACARTSLTCRETRKRRCFGIIQDAESSRAINCLPAASSTADREMRMAGWNK